MLILQNLSNYLVINNLRKTVRKSGYPGLKRIWRWYDYVCGTRLAAILPEALGKLEACGELVVDNEQQTLFRRIGARTLSVCWRLAVVPCSHAAASLPGWAHC